MSQSLPTDDFRWLNHDEIQDLFTKLKDVPKDGAKGYILELDLNPSFTFCRCICNVDYIFPMEDSLKVHLQFVHSSVKSDFGGEDKVSEGLRMMMLFVILNLIRL